MVFRPISRSFHLTDFIPILNEGPVSSMLVLYVRYCASSVHKPHRFEILKIMKIVRGPLMMYIFHILSDKPES